MKWAQVLSVAIKIAPAISQMSADLKELAARKEHSDGGKKITPDEARKICEICAVTIGKLVDDVLEELGLQVSDD